MGRSKDLATGETRFVNTSGDSMTGNLTTTGNVGVGETSPNLGSSGTGLHIKGAASKDGVIKLDSQTADRSGIVQFTENGTDKWRIGYDAASNHLEFTRSGVADRMIISDDGYVTMPNQPVFQAYTLNSGSTNSDLVYPNTRINIGNHYSTSTGRFTAPVAGTYLFGVTNIGGTANDVYRYYIRKNGSAFGDTHLRMDTTESGSAYGTNAMYTWPVTCAASDYVNIYFTSGSSSYTSGDYPQFWGYLIG